MASRPPVTPFLSMILLALAGCGDGGGNAPSVQLDSSITSDRCIVTIGYDGEAAVDLADLVIDYSKAEGSFGDRGYGVRCRSLIANATRATMHNSCENDCSNGEWRALYLGFSMGESSDDLLLRTPAGLFECLFEGDGASLDAIDASIRMAGSNLEEIPARPLRLEVECDGWPETTTSTTSSTTTTLACDGNTCEPGSVVPLQLRLDDDVVLGALQLEIDFPSDAGAFAHYGNSPTVRCTLAGGVNALYATNEFPLPDDGCPDCTRRLIVAFAFGSGYRGPGPLIACDFVVGPSPPSAGSFTLRIVDVSTPSGEPITPEPVVSIHGLP